MKCHVIIFSTQTHTHKHIFSFLQWWVQKESWRDSSFLIKKMFHIKRHLIFSSHVPSLTLLASESWNESFFLKKLFDILKWMHQSCWMLCHHPTSAANATQVYNPTQPFPPGPPVPMTTAEQGKIRFNIIKTQKYEIKINSPPLLRRSSSLQETRLFKKKKKKAPVLQPGVLQRTILSLSLSQAR